jgi:Tfp pilus assembly protein PilF
MVQLELGKTMLSAGQEAEAEQAFAAAAAFGETAEAYEWLGTVRAMRGEMGAAREAYRGALAIDGADGAALDGLARATAMDNGAAPAELQEALLAATAASGGAGRSARSLDTLGMVRWRMGDRAGAAAAAREAMAMAGEQERGIIERHLQMYETGLR